MHIVPVNPIRDEGVALSFCICDGMREVRGGMNHRNRTQDLADEHNSDAC